MIAELKRLANQRDVPYQSLLKVFLAERIQQERAGLASTRVPDRLAESPYSRNKETKRQRGKASKGINSKS